MGNTKWRSFKVVVTLIPKMMRPEKIKEATALFVRYEVLALDQHMAGLLASNRAEEQYEGYQALCYETNDTL